MKRRVSSLAGVMAILVILAAFLPSAGTPRPQSQDAQALTKPLQYEVAVVLKLVQVRVTDK
ncbi:MAG: hypothetical protein ACXWH4_08890, partial [Candidatus Aminicenantales bacterium]